MKNAELQKRVVFGGLAAAVLMIFLWVGGIPFQILVGILSMLGVRELLQMKGLELASIESALTMLAAFVLALPIETYLSWLPVDGNVAAYSFVVFMLLGATVFSDQYSFEDAAFPIAASFYVGYGFHALATAQMAGFNKVLLALFIVWATDSGAYLIGSRFGKRKLMPTVSPNKTLEGSLGGILSAVVVALIFVLIDKSVALPYSRFSILALTVVFSIAGQFGDLVESAMKRHFGFKDSGNFIPGHGGVLDRFDSLLFVFPMMHLLGLF